MTKKKESRNELLDVSPLLEPAYRELAVDPGLWNHGLGVPSRFATDCGKLQGRGINPFREDILRRLWQVGLLRADAVYSIEETHLEGLNLVAEADDFTYIDQRELAQTEGGWIGLLARSGTRVNNALPRFHPYRYVVLFKLLEAVKPAVSPLQLFLSDDGILDVTADWQESMRQHTATPLIAEFINHWNSIAMLAAACEPVAFSTISRLSRASLPDSFSQVRERREAHYGILKPIFLRIGLDYIEELRAKLCRLAQLVEPNVRIHMLMRIAHYRRREAIRGDLGKAMLFLEMAECLRRVAERTFGEHLPEEDQVNYTVWADGARQNIYGAERMLDAPKNASRIFVRYFGLDPGIKVRCYVEGDTELGALEYSVGSYEHIEIVNLRGQVSAARGKGLSFKENLAFDMEKKVFSVVILDGDRGDNLRAVRRAILDDSFFGEFFISNPDCELQNFSMQELRNLILQIATERCLNEAEMAELRLMIRDAEEVKGLLEKARCSSDRLRDLGKGSHWGASLVQYALELGGQDVGVLDQSTYGRPVLEMIARILRATHFHYDLSREASCVDPVTGRLVPIGS